MADLFTVKNIKIVETLLPVMVIAVVVGVNQMLCYENLYPVLLYMHV